MSLVASVQEYLTCSRELEKLGLAEQQRQREVERLIWEHDTAVLTNERNELNHRVDSLSSQNHHLTMNLNKAENDLSSLKGNSKLNLELERKNQRLTAEISNLKQIQEQHKQLKNEKKILDKKLNDINSKSEGDKRSLEKFERERGELQKSEKALKKEVSDLKTQLHKQTAAVEKASKELERQKTQFTNQKSVMESKMETLKAKVNNNNNMAKATASSPSRPSFSPALLNKNKPAIPSSLKQSSSFSTTPFLQRNSILPGPTVNSPSPLKKGTQAATPSSTSSNTKRRLSQKPQLTFTSKNTNKKISLFDEDEDEAGEEKHDGGGDATAASPKSKTKFAEKRKKRRLKAQSFQTVEDEDDPDLPGSLFKRVKKPTSSSSDNTNASASSTGLFGNKDFSPLKKRNEAIRNQFKV